MRSKARGALPTVLAAFILATACDNSVSAFKTACPESGHRYWNSFRNAVASGDAEAVADMTRFPFTLSAGITDDGRQIAHLDRREFKKVLPKLLASDCGMTETPLTMKNYAGSLTVLPPQSCTPDGKQFRVGDWVFQRNAEGWRFVHAYLDEDDAP